MIEAIVVLVLLAFVGVLIRKSLHSPEYRHLLRLEKAKRSWAKMLTEGDKRETKS